MTNPVAAWSDPKQVTAPPRLHPSLTGAATSGPKSASSQRSLLPPVLMVLAGLYAAQAAEFTAQAWPLAVLLALPIGALLYAWQSKPRPVRTVPRREARELIDRRPILLRPILVIQPGRPPRITGRVHAKLAGPAPQQSRVRLPPQRGSNPSSKHHRPAKIIQQRWIMPGRPM